MMQRFALLVLLALSANAEQASLRSSRQLYNSNSSSSSSSSSSSGWSFWGSLLQLLDHVHAPCPPGPLHHKDENGDPLKRGECWSDLHHPPKPKKKSSSSNSSSSKSKVTYSACEQGEDGCFENVNCADGGDCNEYIKCVDQDGNAVDCFTNDDGQNIGGNGWKDDGYSVTDDATDDNSATDDAQNVVDDQWGSDGWSASNLDSGNSFASKSGNKSTPVWPFIVGALVAGVIGAAFIVSRRKRREEDSHPLDGSIKKRQKLFSGFSRNKKGALNEDFDNEEGKPNFIEIGEHNKRTNSYAAPRNLVDDNSEYSR